MGKIYCLRCNRATEFSNPKPSFCSHCGKPYIDSTASTIPVAAPKPTFQPSVTHSRVRRTEPEYIDENDETQDVQEMPVIDKIEFNLDTRNIRPTTQSGRDLFNEGTQNDANEVLSNRKTHKEISKIKQKEIKESFKQDFAKQLASNKNKPSEIG